MSPMENYDGSPILGLLLSKLIPYRQLDEALLPILPQDLGHANFMVDLHSLYNNVVSPQSVGMFEALGRSDRWAIAAATLNLAAHYRHYMWTRRGAYTTFYMYYCSERSRYHVEGLGDAGWRAEWYRRRLCPDDPEFGRMSRILAENLSAARIIAKYAPHVYVIDTGPVDPIGAALAILRSKGAAAQVNVVLSNDQTQSVLAADLKSTVVLQSRSTNSAVVDRANLMLPYYRREKDLPKTLRPQDDAPALAMFIRLWNAAAGHHGAGVPAVRGLNVRWFIETTRKRIASGELELRRYRPSEAAERLRQLGDMTDAQAEALLENAKRLDPATCRLGLLPAEVDRMSDQVVDVDAPRSLRDACAEYLQGLPLNLNFLLDGERGQ